MSEATPVGSSMGEDSISAAQLQPCPFEVMVLEPAYHIDAGLLADSAHMAQGCRLCRVQPDALLANILQHDAVGQVRQFPVC